MRIFQELYEAELERRQQLQSAVPLPTGVLSFLGGLLIVMLREFEWAGGPIQWVFAPLAILSGLMLVVSASYLVRSYWKWGQQTHYVAKANELLEWFRELEQYHLEHVADGGSPSKYASDEMERSLRVRFAESASYNAQENDRRSELLYRANGFLVLTLVGTGLAAVPYSLHSL